MPCLRYLIVNLSNLLTSPSELKKAVKSEEERRREEHLIQYKKGKYVMFLKNNVLSRF